MNLFEDYFNPVDKRIRNHSFDEGTYGKVCITKKEANDLKGVKIALLGIPETRNANLGAFDIKTDLIRSYFYKLTEISRLNVIDLGNLKLGKTVKDTYVVVKDIISELIRQDITPVIIGGSQELTVPMVEGIVCNYNSCELSVIDARVDANAEELHSHSFINYIDDNKKQQTHVSIIGYQSYFVPNKLLNAVKVRGWDLFRLGAVRNNFNQIEPILRDSDIISFDIAAIRQGDNPATIFPSPNGFYAEEACQLANLSGLSDRVKVFSLFEYNSELDINNQSAHLLAQIIWHFLYGFSQRKRDYPKRELDNYKKIYVKIKKMDIDLVFYKNIDNGRYWVEIPMGIDNKCRVISCSENDYQKACNNDVPDRIWQNMSRLLK